ncbi:hypothetical protein MP228_005653 [Amoeboaphelidium protococcarum]|nr:hypothetical protein MP228_005653 [Amoeboaphelidium protococcarum]
MSMQNLYQYKKQQKLRGNSLRHRVRVAAWNRIQSELSAINQLQKRWRGPFLDFICAVVLTAMGTHTAFLVGLPLLFLFYDNGGLHAEFYFARHMTIICGLCVAFTGVLKDYLCLPRPPALDDIKHSGDGPNVNSLIFRIKDRLVTRLLHTKGSYHTQEYGAPSTHACNSTAIVTFIMLHHYILPLYEGRMDPFSNGDMIFIGLLMVYAIALPLSRVYCGMHSFTDVQVGGALGMSITLGWQFIAINYLNIDQFVIHSPPVVVLGASLIIYYICFVHMHPSPMKKCPCYADTVSNCAVIAGVLYGTSDFALTARMNDFKYGASIPFVFDWQRWYLPLSFMGLGAAADGSHIPVLSVWGICLRAILMMSMLLLWRLVAKAFFNALLTPVYAMMHSYYGEGHLNSWMSSGLSEAVACEDQSCATDHTEDLLHPSRNSHNSVGDMVLQDGNDSGVSVSSSLSEYCLSNEHLEEVSQHEDDLTLIIQDILSLEYYDGKYGMEFSFNKLSLDMTVKFLVYFGIGMLAVDHIPRLILYLKL